MDVSFHSEPTRMNTPLILCMQTGFRPPKTPIPAALPVFPDVFLKLKTELSLPTMQMLDQGQLSWSLRSKARKAWTVIFCSVYQE